MRSRKLAEGDNRVAFVLRDPVCCVNPRRVDPHTHVIWAGDRADEFEQRLAGATYQDIMAAGGGINKTMRTVADYREREAGGGAVDVVDSA